MKLLATIFICTPWLLLAGTAWAVIQSVRRSMVKKKWFICPACGAPERDLMPNSDLCYRCYWWALRIITVKEANAKLRASK